MGGNSVDEDVKNFKNNGGNIVICTPGRLEDLLTRRQDVNFANALKNLVNIEMTSRELCLTKLTFRRF